MNTRDISDFEQTSLCRISYQYIIAKNIFIFYRRRVIFISVTTIGFPYQVILSLT